MRDTKEPKIQIVITSDPDVPFAGIPLADGVEDDWQTAKTEPIETDGGYDFSATEPSPDWL